VRPCTSVHPLLLPFSTDPTHLNSSTAPISLPVAVKHVAHPRLAQTVIISFPADLPAVSLNRLQRALLPIMSFPDPCCNQLARLPGRSCTARYHRYLLHAHAAVNRTATRPPTTTFFNPLSIPNTSAVLSAASVQPSSLRAVLTLVQGTHRGADYATLDCPDIYKQIMKAQYITPKLSSNTNHGHNLISG
jgi:hypothetical protein